MLEEKFSANTLNSHTTQFVDKQCFDEPRNKKPKRNHCHTLHEENVGLPHSVQAAKISSTNINLKERKSNTTESG